MQWNTLWMNRLKDSCGPDSHYTCVCSIFFLYFDKKNISCPQSLKVLYFQTSWDGRMWHSNHPIISAKWDIGVDICASCHFSRRSLLCCTLRTTSGHVLTDMFAAFISIHYGEVIPCGAWRIGVVWSMTCNLYYYTHRCGSCGRNTMESYVPGKTYFIV